MGHTARYLVVALCACIALSSCAEAPYSVRIANYSDLRKDIRITFYAYPSGKGSMLIDIRPSYDSLLKGKTTVPTVVETVPFRWKGTWHKMKITNIEGQILANINDINGVSIIHFIKFPLLIDEKDYGNIPLRFMLHNYSSLTLKR